MTDPTTGDLIPLCRFAKRLGVRSIKLREWAKQGAFPSVFRVGPGVYRVSESAAERWLLDREIRERKKGTRHP